MRSGRRFWLGKRRRTTTRRGCCSENEREDYELDSHLDEGSSDKEEEYQLIFEEEKEEEAPYPNQDYNILVTPRTSPDVRSRNTSPNGFANQTDNNSGNNSKVTPIGGIFNSTIRRVNKMVGNDLKLPIFNKNGLEKPEKHWFLCEVVWTM